MVHTVSNTRPATHGQQHGQNVRPCVLCLVSTNKGTVREGMGGRAGLSRCLTALCLFIYECLSVSLCSLSCYVSVSYYLVKLMPVMARG